MKSKFKYIFLFIMIIMFLFSFTSCQEIENVNNNEIITLSKRKAISSNGQTLSVKATLTPSYANDTVTWSVSWATTYSQNINNYITLTPSTDTLTCSVKAKSAFSKRIILTCTLVSNTSIKKTCYIDYVGRTYGVSVDYENVKTLIDDIDLTFEQLGEHSLELISSFSTSGGTLTGTVKNICIEYEEEWETDFGYCFYISDYSAPITEDGIYNAIMDSEMIYVPISFDVYYGGTKLGTYYGSMEIYFV